MDSIPPKGEKMLSNSEGLRDESIFPIQRDLDGDWKSCDGDSLLSRSIKTDFTGEWALT